MLKLGGYALVRGDALKQDVALNRSDPLPLLPGPAAGEATSTGKKGIGAAVHAEKERLIDKKATKPADTELGRSLQNQLGASSALINRRVKEVATEVLRRSPDSGRKQ